MIVTEQNVRFLRQGVELLSTLDAGIFAETGLGGQRGSIGAHLRHCIDYYRCFVRGQAGGRVDYDARERDPRIEVEPSAAAAAVEALIGALARLRPDDFDRPVEVKVDAAAWHDPALAWSHSSVGRELQFLLSHTVHHYALIAMILRSRGLAPPDDFGVAPSTLEHRHEVEAAGETAVCAR